MLEKILLPALDGDFVPMSERFRQFEERVGREGGKPFLLCVYRKKSCARFAFDIFSEPCEENLWMAERIAKSLLWSAGGFRIYAAGDASVARHLKDLYRPGGARAFDAALMSRIFERPFEVVSCKISDVPDLAETSARLGGSLDGCRIGFDAGGSDRKVVALQDGAVVYSEEVDWQPKVQTDGRYLAEGVESAIRNAAARLPRVDGIGVSSAGICVDNKLMESSLLRRLPPEQKERMRSVYIDVARKYGVPLTVANDGDVTALAGALRTGSRKILGIAMGTSEAAGYLNGEGRVGGWISELSSVPIDAGKFAVTDLWSGDVGCGGKYLSQEGVLRLAARAGIELAGTSSARKLRRVQELLSQGDERAAAVFRDVGIYLGYALVYYSLFYEIDRVLVLGRVMSGGAGELVLKGAREVLEQYPSHRFSLEMPGEKDRRLGQAFAAATLPPSRPEIG